MTNSRPIRIGTRGSKLARWQANWVADQLRQSSTNVEIKRIETTGDVRTGAIAEFGGEGVFTKEIQRALLAGDVDIAVHSLKDLPTESPPGLVLRAIPLRESNRDTLISSSGQTLQRLSPGARIGTGSLRRKAQLLNMRSDLRVEDIRGNVETRLEKVTGGGFDAIVLAEAGLKRLGLEDRITQIFTIEEMLPAVGQGALGIEVREDDRPTHIIVQPLHHADSAAAVTAERSLLRTLCAGCLAPVGAHADLDGGQLHLRAVVLSPNGASRIDAEEKGPADCPERLGKSLAERLIEMGAAGLIRQSRV